MPFLAVLELALDALLIAFVATQILWPLVERKPLFPMFRKHPTEKQLELLEEEVDEAELKHEVAELEALRKQELREVEKLFSRRGKK